MHAGRRWLLCGYLRCGGPPLRTLVSLPVYNTRTNHLNDNIIPACMRTRSQGQQTLQRYEYCSIDLKMTGRSSGQRAADSQEREDGRASKQEENRKRRTCKMPRRLVASDETEQNKRDQETLELRGQVQNPARSVETESCNAAGPALKTGQLGKPRIRMRQNV